jgi:hypothetical protein
VTGTLFKPTADEHWRIGWRRRLIERGIARFWRKVNKNGPIPQCKPELGPCWIWTAYLDAKGYGQFSLNGLLDRTHRFSYLLSKGEVPYGYELDHLCRNPSCVRPSHLEAVTHRVNMLRGKSPMIISHLTKTCKRGHRVVGKNAIYFPKSPDKRRCKKCIDLHNSKATREKFFGRNNDKSSAT